MVSASGRVTRIENNNPKLQPEAPKMSFMSVIEKRDPKQMFANLERLTKMVGKGIQPSLVITGSAGTGKTFLVKDTLTKMGLKESNEFVHFKGRATAAGLFVTLYDNCDKIIVLDDCDSVFKDPDAVNMLKAALDSYDTRNISYITSKPLKDQFGTHLPRSFEFTGKIIFISNLDQSTLDEAIRSRSFVSDISMTTEQMFMRIEGLMEKMEDKIPTKAKQQAMTIMKELHEKYDGISVNLRSFIKAARICAMGFENAKDMVAEQIIEV
jgi:replication-associated recombination protein RarA